MKMATQSPENPSKPHRTAYPNPLGPVLVRITKVGTSLLNDWRTSNVLSFELSLTTKISWLMPFE
jgi:hypothetical protein